MLSSELREGFLVVAPAQLEQGPLNSRPGKTYHGVGRIPGSIVPFVIGSALDRYVFGGIKDEESNLIHKYSAALELQEAFASEGTFYEIIYCSTRVDPGYMNVNGVSCPYLGMDVAYLGGYYSVIEDHPLATWADKYAPRLNIYGLFSDYQDAVMLVQEYEATEYAHPDGIAFIVHVFQVPPPTP